MALERERERELLQRLENAHLVSACYECAPKDPFNFILYHEDFIYRLHGSNARYVSSLSGR